MAISDVKKKGLPFINRRIFIDRFICLLAAVHLITTTIALIEILKSIWNRALKINKVEVNEL